MVHRREVDGEVLVFGNQGALWGNAMTWWDHDSGSVWSQPLGEAIMGPRKEAKLDLIASELTRWGPWKEEHPETVALDAPGRESGFSVDHMTIVVDFSEDVGVYPVSELNENGPANDVVAGVPIAVVTDPTTEDRWKVFHRQAGDTDVTLVRSGDRILDEETGTTWDPASGRGLDGPLEGEILGILPAFTSFQDDALKFWPDARVWGDEDGA